MTLPDSPELPDPDSTPTHSSSSLSFISSFVQWNGFGHSTSVLGSPLPPPDIKIVNPQSFGLTSMRPTGNVLGSAYLVLFIHSVAYLMFSFVLNCWFWR